MVKFHQLGSSFVTNSKDTFDELYRGGNHYDSSCAWKVLHWATKRQRKQRCIRCHGRMDDGWIFESPNDSESLCCLYIYIVDGKNSKKKSWSFWKKITNIQGNKDDIFQLFLFINLLFFLFEGIRVEGFFLFWTTFFSFLVMGLFKILYFWSCWSFVLSCSSVFFVGGFEDFEVCKIHID